MRRALFNWTPLLEMPNDHLLSLRRRRALPNPPNIQCPILPVEASNTTHIITVVAELVTREAVFGRVGENVFRVREGVPVLAFPAVWAASTSEEEADVFVASGVGAGESCVAFDVAAGLGFGFAVSVREVWLAWRVRGITKNTNLE